MAEFDYRGTKIIFEETGLQERPVVLWAHGWGQDKRAFSALAASLPTSARHILLDLPGFGQSGIPPEPWSTADYADAAAAFIRQTGAQKILWVGHSFGCRVGLQLAARYPDLVGGLFLIAAAGLPRQRSRGRKIYMKARIRTFKLLKKTIPFGLNEDWLMKKFASPDYKNAGAMRAIFVRTVNEDLTPLLKDITCPVQLVYGRNDRETPPEIGERLQKNIRGAQLAILDGQDHYTLLGDGRHPVVRQIKSFIEQNT